MKTLWIVAGGSTFVSSIMAHDSVAPHSHVLDSQTSDLYWLCLAGAVLATAAVVAGISRRRSPAAQAGRSRAARRPSGPD